MLVSLHGAQLVRLSRTVVQHQHAVRRDVHHAQNVLGRRHLQRVRRTAFAVHKLADEEKANVRDLGAAVALRPAQRVALLRNTQVVKGKGYVTVQLSSTLQQCSQ